MEARAITLPSARPAREAPIERAEWLRLAARARWLSWFSLAYMTLEGAIAITAGIMAGSVALIGFGIDSAIEGFASLVIVWRFTGARLLSHSAERRAQILVAIQFFLLAPYITYEAAGALAGGEKPYASWLGIALAASSLAVMPYLGRAKQRIGERMGSVATKGEGQQNLICAYLSAALLVGLLGNAALGLWWLDPVAALVIAAVAFKEGVEAWRDEGCCAPGGLPAPDESSIDGPRSCGCQSGCNCC
jgi:divalent metal cation (Fe/Co/Zn/Cd) transporter